MKYTPKIIIKGIYNRLVLFIRLNILKTLYMNFRTQPFLKAIKLPIFVYGKLIIHTLEGALVIDGPIKRGMIKIGYRYVDLWPTSCLPTQLWLSGKCIFRGRTIVSGGVALFVQDNSAVLSIGNACIIGAGSMIKARDNLIIGDNTIFAANCQIMDTNIHYVKNIETGEIIKPWGPIIIGNNCWLNEGTIVTKDTIMPDYSITARNSFLNKDYSPFGTNLFLVGSPAVPKGPKVQLILNTLEEKRLKSIFLANPHQRAIKEEPGLFNGENNFL